MPPRSATTAVCFLPTDCEAAVIATPAETHYRIARAFLAAGKHVLVEKPMSSRSRRHTSCVFARRSGVILMVGHILLYHPALRYLKDSTIMRNSVRSPESAPSALTGMASGLSRMRSGASCSRHLGNALPARPDADFGRATSNRAAEIVAHSGFLRTEFSRQCGRLRQCQLADEEQCAG